MRDLSYLWVFVGLAIVADIAFLIWGRRKGGDPRQIKFPFQGPEKRATKRRESDQHATVG